MIRRLLPIPVLLLTLLLSGCGGEKRYYALEFAVEVTGAVTQSFSGGGREPDGNEPRAWWLPSVGDIDGATRRRVIQFEDPASGTVIQIFGVTYDSAPISRTPSADGTTVSARLVTKEGKVFRSGADAGIFTVDDVSFTFTQDGNNSVSLDIIEGSIQFIGVSNDDTTVDVNITYRQLPINVET